MLCCSGLKVCLLGTGNNYLGLAVWQSSALVWSLCSWCCRPSRDDHSTTPTCWRYVSLHPASSCLDWSSWWYLGFSGAASQITANLFHVWCSADALLRNTTAGGRFWCHDSQRFIPAKFVLENIQDDGCRLADCLKCHLWGSFEFFYCDKEFSNVCSIPFLVSVKKEKCVKRDNSRNTHTN